MEKIIELIRKNKDSLKNTYNIEKIGIFGSFAKDNQNDSSDIDILVEFSEPIGYFKFIELEQFLEKVLGKKVDLATKNSLKLSIKKEVLKDTIYA
ncbi:MAG: nucleotidyltransferase family protein [Candidatus Pacebacteria bacterium]|nr:nucleotidyltransferase family protein [Candidatus Paceibacterota bacterium]